MEFRPTPDVDPVELSFDEFAALVRTGTVRPKAQYRSKWTNYEWRPVDRIPKFLELVPPDYEYEAELRERREESARRELEARRLEELEASYASGELIETRYGLETLEHVASSPGVVGAARFMILPSFAAERVVTFRFGKRSVALEGVYQEHVGQGPPLTCEPRVIRSQGKLRYSKIPRPFTSWQTFLHQAFDLPPCRTPTLDGVSYVQRILVDGRVRIAVWSNPNSRTPRQFNMVRAYLACLRMAGMGEIGE